MKPIIDTRLENSSFPQLPANPISRDQFLSMFESLLADNDMIFVSGIGEGSGVTTALSMFVERHCSECFSFFTDGIDLFSQESEVIEESLARQMYLYNKNGRSFDGEHLDLESQIPALKKTGRVFYFVFDGFDKLPKEKAENIKKTFEKLNARQFRFILSGKKENYTNLLSLEGRSITDGILLTQFLAEEVKQYFLPFLPTSEVHHLQSLIEICHGTATMIEFFRQKLECGISLEKYVMSDSKRIEDFYSLDLSDIKAFQRYNDLKVIALIAFAGIPLTRESICRLLEISDQEMGFILDETNAFLTLSDKHIVFRSVHAQKFIRKELSNLQMPMSLLMIDFFEDHLEAYLPFLPPLYRQFNRGRLLDFLKSDKVLRILVEKQSQAALNVQCGYGFRECNSDSPISDVLPFSLFKSASREVEQSGVWDNEIEALTSIGDFETAIVIAQNVFLKEEKLKCYAIIANQQREQFKQVDNQLMQDIYDLHRQIEYEHLPDMAIGLAKLLLTIDFKLSLEIVDRISKQKDAQSKDKLFMAMSLTSMVYKPVEESNEERFGQFTSRIVNDGVRQFTDALKTLFEDSSVDDFLMKVDSLPTGTQKLRLLRGWIPANKKKEGIFKAVDKALKLVVTLSGEQIPKGNAMLDIVSALPYLTEMEFKSALQTLDSINPEIRFPSDAYTMVQLKAVSTQVKFDENAAIQRLKTLFEEIKKNSSPSAILNCESIILRNYRNLGNKENLCSGFMSEAELMNLVEQQTIRLLSESAYHLKVLDSPVKSLITEYPELVIRIIGYSNTDETKSRAFLMAAKAYLQQTKTDKLDYDLLLKLINQIDYPVELRSEVLIKLANKCYSERKAAIMHLSKLKMFDQLFHNIEKYDERSEAFGYLYLVFLGQTGEEIYTDSLLKRCLESWNNTHRENVKITRGFSLGKLLSKANPDLARDIIQKTCDIKKESILSSSASMFTFLLSLDIYVRSLGASIRSGHASDDIIDNFQKVLDQINSPSDSIIFWGQLALNYYVAKDEEHFRIILHEKIVPLMETATFQNSSPFNKEQVIFNIAPVLYLQDRDQLYNQVKQFDEYFQNACIEHTLKFLLMKHPNINDAKWDVQYSSFRSDDKEKVIDLLHNCKDDQIIYETMDVICRTIVGRTSEPFSNIQRNTIYNSLSDIVDKQLPTVHGIKHHGYKLVCEAALQLINPNPKKDYWQDLEKRIDNISNKADQAFIFICASQYIPTSNGAIKSSYIQKGFSIASSLAPVFDRMNRLDMCVTNGKLKRALASPKVREIIVNILTDGDGTKESRKKMIDLAQQFDSRLMDSMAEEFDNDPARSYYKKEVEGYISHQKRLGAARKEISSIRQLDNKEFSEYFEQRLSDQILSKVVTWSEDKLYDVIQSIYKFPLYYTYESVLAIIENASRMTNSKKQRELIESLCHISFWNLKIVMSLSSGTKEKIDRINNAIKEEYDKNDILVHVGERKKAIERIVRWYENHKMPELRIIDSHFKPEDLVVVKKLLDVNNELKIRILTLTNNSHNTYEYQEKWEDICKDTNVDIQLRVIHYKENPASGPLHNRHWILTDGSEFVGIDTNSLSGYGNKESAITEMPKDETNGALELWKTLFEDKVKMYKGKLLTAQIVTIGEY